MVGTFLLALMVITPTDQTVQTPKGTKLDVNNFAGDVNIKVWDKDAVRVEVNNSDRETVDIKQGDQTVTVRSRSLRGGRPRSLDYTISVPSWMAITVAGTYADVTMEGVGGDVSVETTHGDVRVRGGSGFVTAGNAACNQRCLHERGLQRTGGLRVVLGTQCPFVAAWRP